MVLCQAHVTFFKNFWGNSHFGSNVNNKAISTIWDISTGAYVLCLPRGNSSRCTSVPEASCHLQTSTSISGHAQSEYFYSVLQEHLSMNFYPFLIMQICLKNTGWFSSSLERVAATYSIRFCLEEKNFMVSVLFQSWRSFWNKRQKSNDWTWNSAV